MLQTFGIAQDRGPMAKTNETKSSDSSVMTGAAEIIGGALGTIAGAVDRFRADHPHPVDEAKEALVAGQQQVAQVAAEAGKRATVMIDATKAVIKNVRKRSATVRARAAQARPPRAKKTVKATKPAARTTVKRAKNANKKKPAKRANNVVARGKKSAPKTRAAARRRKR
jgi:hypothetical protein